MPNAPVSVQLYSVRDAIAADLRAALDRVAAIGFENVELYGFVDKVDEYATALEATGLRALSAHASLVGSDDVQRTLDAAATLGVTTLIDPAVREENWTSREALTATADFLNELAPAAAERGITLGYHNHWWELESQVDGRPALEVFAELLDPAVVLEVDTYWVEVGGVAAPALLERLGDRVKLIHVKDGSATRETKEQQPAGRGIVPVPAILAAAPDAVRVIEFDDYAGDVFEGIAESLTYLKENA
ncbi:sugar phosphate isomerase/epimerase [Diaminobutyricimonas aerilata]|uniref:Sugar phosphate isomerase/epimerase n=1 Tax=Diaminobutyricimonas aerilata TaxID=1162967 RepID=A0A2M9CGK2_9MICO|nr:sugar phosphate isomerase/epimerase [Diaminobutyricimonas aerilata]PJJ70992.1 sugar phosphate isomerase/epimerase [Diaminobutyricimonas aerilata]